MEEMFSSLICFYLFFLYISFGTFFGQGIAPASQRGVKQCNQNMESVILRQYSLALSPWPSKAFKSHIFIKNSCHGVGSKNAGRNWSGGRSFEYWLRDSPGQWVPETDCLRGSAIFVSGTSGITSILNYRSVSPTSI